MTMTMGSFPWNLPFKCPGGKGSLFGLVRLVFIWTALLVANVVGRLPATALRACAQRGSADIPPSCQGLSSRRKGASLESGRRCVWVGRKHYDRSIWAFSLLVSGNKYQSDKSLSRSAGVFWVFLVRQCSSFRLPSSDIILHCFFWVKRDIIGDKSTLLDLTHDQRPWVSTPSQRSETPEESNFEHFHTHIDSLELDTSRTLSRRPTLYI